MNDALHFTASDPSTLRMSYQHQRLWDEDQLEVEPGVATEEEVKRGGRLVIGSCLDYKRSQAQSVDIKTPSESRSSGWILLHFQFTLIKYHNQAQGQSKN